MSEKKKTKYPPFGRLELDVEYKFEIIDNPRMMADRFTGKEKPVFDVRCLTENLRTKRNGKLVLIDDQTGTLDFGRVALRSYFEKYQEKFVPGMVFQIKLENALSEKTGRYYHKPEIEWLT